MNLTETIQALEAKNIAIALNLGTHQHCAIDSNCPLAVELRRLMVDAGVTLEQLLEGYTAVTATDPVDYILPEIDGRVSITIAGTQVELELGDVIAEKLKHAIDVKRQELKDQQVRIKHLGNGLYNSYLRAIKQARESPILPQLKFSRKELMKANCHVTCNSDSYIFLFPTEYHPEYMVRYVRRSIEERDTCRYKIADEDIERLREPAWVELTVRGNRFINAMLLRETGRGLVHYHGSSDTACWGMVKIPQSWDGTLKSLVELKTLIMGSLATINANSILNHEPTGKPHYNTLLNRCTELGEEGTVAPQPRDASGRFTAREEEPALRGTGWGATTRDGETAPQVELNIMERTTQERFNRTTAPLDYDICCNLCGERYGDHYDTAERGLICPRDH